VSGTATVQVNAADAQDAAGSLAAQVQIDSGAWQAATYNSSTSRYELSWNTTTVTNGGHMLTARATDSGTSTTTTASLSVTVNNVASNTAPVVSITSPSNGSTVVGSITIQVNATDAQDAAGTLSVQVQIDGGAWQAATYNGTASRYQLNWNTTTVSEGSHTIGARATDSGTFTTVATPISVTVDNVPDPPAAYSLVHSTSSDRSNPHPLDGATISGNLYAFTTPDTAEIVRVRFWLDNPTMTGQPKVTESTAPYDFAGGTATNANRYNSRGMTNGPHTITAAISLTDGSTVVVHATFNVAN
jgi:hypothetical protein